MKVYLTHSARRDFKLALGQTLEKFGPQQLERYAEMFRQAFALIADDPHRPTSKSVPGLRGSIRAFHLQNVGRRKGSAAHTLYYCIDEPGADSPKITVLRILGDGAKPKRRLGQAVREETYRER